MKKDRNFFFDRNSNKTMRKGIIFLIAFWSAILFTAPVNADIRGEFQRLPLKRMPEEHSLKQVTIHEVIAFDCPHCYAFYRDQSTLLKNKFGNKIKIIVQPIGWRGPDPGRLMFIAQENGKQHEVIMMIFDFVFNKGLGESMFQRDKLQFVAQMNGLSTEFKTRMDAPEIIQKMNNSVQFAQQRNIQSTPTVIIEDAISAVPYYSNLVSIINSLLKEPVK